METPTPEVNLLRDQTKKIARSLYELVEANYSSSLLSAVIKQKTSRFVKKNPEEDGDRSQIEEHTVSIVDGENKESEHLKSIKTTLQEGGLGFPAVAFENVNLLAAPDQTVTTPYDNLEWEGKDALNRYLPAQVVGPDGKIYRFLNTIYLDMDGNGLVEERVISSGDNFAYRAEEIARGSKKVDFQPKEADSMFRHLRIGDLEKINSFLADAEEGKFVVNEHGFK